jgi:hypothetical protein
MRGERRLGWAWGALFLSLPTHTTTLTKTHSALSVHVCTSAWAAPRLTRRRRAREGRMARACRKVFCGRWAEPRRFLTGHLVRGHARWPANAPRPFNGVGASRVNASGKEGRCGGAQRGFRLRLFSRSHADEREKTGVCRPLTTPSFLHFRRGGRRWGFFPPLSPDPPIPPPAHPNTQWREGSTTTRVRASVLPTSSNPLSVG